MKIIESKPALTAEVRRVLEERKEDGEELGYEQINALEHATAFSKLDEKKSKALVKKLMEANEKVDIEAATKIADVLPNSPELMKTLLLRKKVELNDEEIAALLKIVG